MVEDKNSNLKIIEGDLLESDAKYIVHQCNCVSKIGAHLAADIFKKYPYSNIYKDRIKGNREDVPGKIIIRGNGKDKRYIINLLGQYYPGKSQVRYLKVDGVKERKDYFFSGLKKITEIDNLESIAFPWGIGCGLAGGDWDFYYKLIDKFANFVNDKVGVLIYRLNKNIRRK